MPYTTDGVPYVKGSDTSLKAALETNADSDRRLVAKALLDAGDNGLTDGEIERMFNMAHQTASARRRDLVLLRLVKDSKRRRDTSTTHRTAVVWVATEKLKTTGYAGGALPKRPMPPTPAIIRQALAAIDRLLNLGALNGMLPSAPLLVVAEYLQELAEYLEILEDLDA